MSDIKSYQRLLAVQAIYENLINIKEDDPSFDSSLTHIVQNAQFKNKLHGSKLLLSREILNGVHSNSDTINKILENSLKNKSKTHTLDKLLLSIFRCAIYEISIKKKISKKILISEYLLISNHFFSTKEASLLNGVLDNLREI